MPPARAASRKGSSRLKGALSRQPAVTMVPRVWPSVLQKETSELVLVLSKASANMSVAVSFGA